MSKKRTKPVVVHLGTQELANITELNLESSNLESSEGISGLNRMSDITIAGIFDDANAASPGLIGTPSADSKPLTIRMGRNRFTCDVYVTSVECIKRLRRGRARYRAILVPDGPVTYGPVTAAKRRTT